ncbi:MAG: lysylphosphatidylglycerol synthase transmembrane domain-containing protein [Gemmatimonadaceae bacterium]
MKISWRGLIGLALTVGLLWWAFHDVRWADLWKDIRTANPLLVALSVVTATMVFPLRAARWRPILDPIAPRLPYGPLWRATAIGFMANNLLPTGRAGEIVRPYMLSRETQVPFSAAFASLVVDRVFDAVTVILLIAVALLDPSRPEGLSVGMFATTTVAVVAGLAIALYAIVFFPNRLIRLFELVAQRVAPRFEERGRIMLRSFADGLSVLRHPRRFLVIFAWALAHWLVQPVAFWIMFKAIGIEAPFSAALLVQGIIVLAVTVPSTPGFFGLFEVAAQKGLGLYGVNESLALAWALTFHVLSLIPITVIGLYYLARSGVHLGELKEIKR